MVERTGLTVKAPKCVILTGLPRVSNAWKDSSKVSNTISSVIGTFLVKTRGLVGVKITLWAEIDL